MDQTITETFFSQKIRQIIKSGVRIEFTPYQIYFNEMLVEVVIQIIDEIGTNSIHPSISKDSINLYESLPTFFRD
jgi:hypothetical protein